MTLAAFAGASHLELLAREPQAYRAALEDFVAACLEQAVEREVAAFVGGALAGSGGSVGVGGAGSPS